MNFIDLYAGLGGFHLALKELDHTCVFASEIDEELRNVYKKNFGVRPAGDIRNVSIEDIPAHDILCAGFPCQPFSKAGDQQGFDCLRWGDLFDFVIKTIEYHKPDHFILENVPNIKKHNKGTTWEAILDKLSTPDWGYTVDPDGRLSPRRLVPCARTWHRSSDTAGPRSPSSAVCVTSRPTSSAKQKTRL